MALLTMESSSCSSSRVGPPGSKQLEITHSCSALFNMGMRRAIRSLRCCVRKRKVIADIMCHSFKGHRLRGGWETIMWCDITHTSYMVQYAIFVPFSYAPLLSPAAGVGE